MGSIPGARAQTDQRESFWLFVRNHARLLPNIYLVPVYVARWRRHCHQRRKGKRVRFAWDRPSSEILARCDSAECRTAQFFGRRRLGRRSEFGFRLLCHAKPGHLGRERLAGECKRFRIWRLPATATSEWTTE